jgi:hypothetical protein
VSFRAVLTCASRGALISPESEPPGENSPGGSPLQENLELPIEFVGDKCLLKVTYFLILVKVPSNMLPSSTLRPWIARWRGGRAPFLTGWPGKMKPDIR